MTRPRFCGVCGRRVSFTSPTIGDVIAYCGAHSDLPQLELVPPDPLTSLPMQAEQALEDVEAARERGA